MKRICKSLLLLCLTASFLGCEDRDAQEYARQLSGVLDTYQGQVGLKIKAEREAYKELAGIYERGQTRGIELALRQERRERARQLATDLIRSEHAVTSSDILSSLRDYGEQDFTATRNLLVNEADAQSQFLGDIEGLEFDLQVIQSLQESLKTLSKPKGQLKRLRDAAVFAQEAKTEFDSLRCQDLDKEAGALSQQIKALKGDAANAEANKAKIASLESLVANLNEQKSNKGCK